MVLIFSRSCRFTVERVSTLWFPEVSHYCPTVPIILVGITDPEKSKESKNENENEGDPPVITQEECEAKAREICAYRYLECDLESPSSVTQVFHESVRACRAPRTKHKQSGDCSLQ